MTIHYVIMLSVILINVMAPARILFRNGTLLKESQMIANCSCKKTKY